MSCPDPMRDYEDFEGHPDYDSKNDKKIRAIKIDSENETVTEIEVCGLRDMQKAVGGLIEVAYRFYDLKSGLETNTIYVDEEGLLKNNPYGFRIDGFSFVGDGLICGFDEISGETDNCTLDVNEIRRSIKFI